MLADRFRVQTEDWFCVNRSADVAIAHIILKFQQKRTNLKECLKAKVICESDKRDLFKINNLKVLLDSTRLASSIVRKRILPFRTEKKLMFDVTNESTSVPLDCGALPEYKTVSKMLEEKSMKNAER